MYGLSFAVCCLLFVCCALLADCCLLLTMLFVVRGCLVRWLLCGVCCFVVVGRGLLIVDCCDFIAV